MKMNEEVKEKRTLLHSRNIQCNGFGRSDGLWDIEARMTDIKSFDMENPDRGGQIVAGDALHDISLIVTVDRTMLIKSVEARIDLSPFTECNMITQKFQQLVGLRIYPGFSRQVKEIFAGIKGCTHLIELLPIISTTAYQTLWQSENGYDGDDPEIHKFLLDSCHALARDGSTVQRFWPEYAGCKDT